MSHHGERFDVPVIIKVRRSPDAATIHSGLGSVEHERRSTITVSLIIDGDGSHVGAQDAKNSSPAYHTIQLTDEQDPFFLYIIRLNAQQFMHLKSEQNLLMDYHSFAAFVRDLLKKILHESSKDAPKHHLELHMPVSGSSLDDFGAAVEHAKLLFIETNVYKRIINLSLEMHAASDAELKAYLAGCLRQAVVEKQTLNADLSQRLQIAEKRSQDDAQQLEKLQREAEKLKFDVATSTNEQIERHSLELSRERERCNQLIRDMQAKLDEDKRDLERMHAKKMWTLEDRVKDLETQNHSISQKASTLESLVREKKTKITSITEEIDNLTHYITAQKRRIGELELRERELQQNNQQLCIRLASLEQQLNDGNLLTERMQSEANATKQECLQLRQQLDERQRINRQLSRDLAHRKKEFEKASEFISKLQSEVEQVKEECSMRSDMAIRHEQDMQTRESQLQLARDEVKLSQAQNDQLSNELTSMRVKFNDASTKLGDAEKLLQLNETTINFLNKKLTIAEESARAPFLSNGAESRSAAKHATYDRNALADGGGGGRRMFGSAESAANNVGSGMLADGGAVRLESAYFGLSK